ncbi:hypothetical protein JGS22_015020 [Streptomyces sp. P38-E01]|uniref:Uncharacterized protein n=1 Tax=Streptomyces tardus TaxID=2780544 RepID=A0A949JPJ0_9ACTN|nr:hypothetical protein [Streptomyces tardus]MBU7598891.1 hypothetical protein [Streptomyces tardus]
MSTRPTRTTHDKSSPEHVRLRLETLSLKLRETSANLDLAKSDGSRLPSRIPGQRLLSHTLTAQALSLRTTRLAAEVRTLVGENPSALESAALSSMLSSTTETAQAVVAFAQAAGVAVSTPGTIELESAEHRQMLTKHATGRRDLWRAAVDIAAASRCLVEHPDAQRFPASMPVLAPPNSAQHSRKPRP